MYFQLVINFFSIKGLDFYLFSLIGSFQGAVLGSNFDKKVLYKIQVIYVLFVQR